MEISVKGRGVEDAGYPYIEITVDGKAARVFLEQKFVFDYGMVFIGPEFEEETDIFIVPPDEAQSRFEPLFLKGYVANNELTRAVIDYILDSAGDE